MRPRVLEIELEIGSAWDGVVSVRLDRHESETLVKGARFAHGRKRVETHAAVPEPLCFLDEMEHQAASDAASAKLRAHVEALHLTDRVAFERAQRDAGRGPALVLDEQQPPTVLSVLAGQARQLLV